jgi:hypothetical protein
MQFLKFGKLSNILLQKLFTESKNLNVEMLIVVVEYVIFETNMDYYTYLDPLPFLSIIDKGTYYLGGKETIRGGTSCCTY